VLQRLYDAGLSAVGPVSTARLALAMTAVTFPTVALVASPPTGRRNATELAEVLLRDWNVKSLLLCGQDSGQGDWSPPDSQVASLRDALGDLTPLSVQA
jgi:hypothetical protein